MIKAITPLILVVAMGANVAYAQAPAGEAEGLKNAQPTVKKKTTAQMEAEAAKKNEIRATGKSTATVAGESEGLKNAHPAAKKKSPELKDAEAAKKTHVRSNAQGGPVVGDQQPAK